MADPNPLLQEGNTRPPPLTIPGSGWVSEVNKPGKRTPNPFISPPPERINVHGVSWEKKAAAKLGAKLQPASGAMAHAKGDFVSKEGKEFLYEAKSTTNASLQVQLAWLVKISEEAQAKGMSPAVVIGFVFPDGRPRPNCASEWICIPLPVYQELLEKCNE